MALRLIQKVSVLFAPRAAKEAQSITTSFMHLSLLLPSYVPLPVSASLYATRAETRRRCAAFASISLLV